MFTAGPYVAVYRVETSNGNTSAVRCVKFANLLERPDTRGVSFVLYGEGVGSHGAYRQRTRSLISWPQPAGSRA